MTIDEGTKTEKMQYYLNSKTAKISAWWADEIDKYEYIKEKKCYLCSNLE